MNSVQLLGSICIVYSKFVLSTQSKKGHAIAHKLPRSSLLLNWHLFENIIEEQIHNPRYNYNKAHKFVITITDMVKHHRHVGTLGCTQICCSLLSQFSVDPAPPLCFFSRQKVLKNYLFLLSAFETVKYFHTAARRHCTFVFGCMAGEGVRTNYHVSNDNSVFS